MREENLMFRVEEFEVVLLNLLHDPKYGSFPGIL